MPDAPATRLALLQLAEELRRALVRAEGALDSGSAPEMLGAVVDLAHRVASVSLLNEALSRDIEALVLRAEAAEARQRRSLRGALRGLALDAAHLAAEAIRRGR